MCNRQPKPHALHRSWHVWHVGWTSLQGFGPSLVHRMAQVHSSSPQGWMSLTPPGLGSVANRGGSRGRRHGQRCRCNTLPLLLLSLAHPYAVGVPEPILFYSSCQLQLYRVLALAGDSSNGAKVSPFSPWSLPTLPLHRYPLGVVTGRRNLCTTATVPSWYKHGGSPITTPDLLLPMLQGVTVGEAGLGKQQWHPSSSSQHLLPASRGHCGG